MTRGERFAMIVTVALIPVLIWIGWLDVQAWLRDHHPAAPAAATPTTEHTAIVPPVVRPTRTPTTTTTTPPLTTPTRVPSTTDNAPAARAVPATPPPPSPSPSPVYTAGSSCAGHREGLREYDPAGRLVVCTAGSWTYPQPAGTPVPSSTASTSASASVAPAPTTAPTPTTTAAPTTTTAPTTSAAPTTTSSASVTGGASSVTSG